MNITTKFSVGERAYYVIFATASIKAVDILKIYPYNSSIAYDIRQATSTGMVLQGVPESDLYTFSEARAVLITYLRDKLANIETLVAP